MENKFNSKFDQYVCIGDSITVEIGAFEISARVVFDEDYNIDDDDMHNPQVLSECNKNVELWGLHCRKAWFNDEWFYCGIVLSVRCNGIDLNEYAASLHGIECNYPQRSKKKHPNEYLTEVANELLPEAIEAGNKALESLLDSPLYSNANYLLAMAKSVVSRWESGNLAESVQGLTRAIALSEGGTE